MLYFGGLSHILKLLSHAGATMRQLGTPGQFTTSLPGPSDGDVKCRSHVQGKSPPVHVKDPM